MSFPRANVRLIIPRPRDRGFKSRPRNHSQGRNGMGLRGADPEGQSQPRALAVGFLSPDSPSRHPGPVLLLRLTEDSNGGRDSLPLS
jgi:hypothetical protein